MTAQMPGPQRRCGIRSSRSISAGPSSRSSYHSISSPVRFHLWAHRSLIPGGNRHRDRGSDRVCCHPFSARVRFGHRYSSPGLQHCSAGCCFTPGDRVAGRCHRVCFRHGRHANRCRCCPAPAIKDLEVPEVSIGGAGMFGAVFLACVLSALVA